MIRSSLIAGAAVLLASTVLSSTPSSADPYKWCAQYGRDGGRNCGFITLQQCLETVSGIGGHCERNTFYTGPDRSDRQRRSRNR